MVMHWTRKGYVEIEPDDDPQDCFVIGELADSAPQPEGDGGNVFCDSDAAAQACADASLDGKFYACWRMGDDTYEDDLSGIGYRGGYFEVWIPPRDAQQQA